MRTALSLALLWLTVAVVGCSDDGRVPADAARSDAAPPASEETSRELSPVRFYREYVIVEPASDVTTVDALYYFRNDSDRAVTQVIRYPFPVDRFHLYPRVVRVWEKTGDELRPMGFAHRERSVIWRMSLEPRGEKVVRVRYVQDIRSPHAVYIVTTTKEWERPIELAEFEFRIPPELGEVELSFVPDRRETRGDTSIYYMSQTDFMPDEDLVATWKAP